MEHTKMQIEHANMFQMIDSNLNESLKNLTKLSEKLNSQNYRKIIDEESKYINSFEQGYTLGAINGLNNAIISVKKAMGLIE